MLHYPAPLSELPHPGRGNVEKKPVFMRVSRVGKKIYFSLFYPAPFFMQLHHRKE